MVCGKIDCRWNYMNGCLHGANEYQVKQARGQMDQLGVMFFTPDIEIGVDGRCVFAEEKEQEDDEK